MRKDHAVGADSRSRCRGSRIIIISVVLDTTGAGGKKDELLLRLRLT